MPFRSFSSHQPEERSDRCIQEESSSLKSWTSFPGTNQQICFVDMQELRIRTFSVSTNSLHAFANSHIAKSLATSKPVFAPCTQLYHAGIRAPISRSTLAEANESRDYRIYADFAQVLNFQARDLYAQEDFGVALEQTAYVFDSTTDRPLPGSVSLGAFRKHKGAVKIHT